MSETHAAQVSRPVTRNNLVGPTFLASEWVEWPELTLLDTGKIEAVTERMSG